jgi:amino acid adenylation domain-containing protein
MSIFSVQALLDDVAVRLSDKVAVVENEKTISFSELRDRSIAFAGILRNNGVKKGDRIGICMNKSIDQIVAIIGSLYANAVFVPVLPRLKEDNIRHIINDSGMKIMLTESSRIAEVEQFAKEIDVVLATSVHIDGFTNFYIAAESVKDAVNVFDSISEDAAGIIYSSGSTGRPKGIVTSHRNFYDGARIVAKYLGTEENDKIAGVLSFNFDYGLNQIWQTIYKGATLCLHDLLLPNDFFNFIEKQQITALPLMPVIISRIFDVRFMDPKKAKSLKSVKYVCSSGGRVSVNMVENLQKTFPAAKVFLMYGLTEAFRSTFLAPEQVNIRPASIGKAIPESEIYVLDENHNDCPPGVPGELVHRGGCISKGYWNDPEKTAERFKIIDRFPGERVVFSGDLVKTDEEGFIYFISRKDNMLKNSGIRISPSEIEETAEKHPAITAAVVFGIENVEVGYDIALVYRTSSKEPVPQAELISYLKANLPTHMVPKYQVHQVDFPATGNEGKVDRVTVIEQAKKTLGV